MTCSSCQEKIQKALQNVKGVTNAHVDWRKGEADITMSSHINTTTLQEALKAYPKYKLIEKMDGHSSVIEEEKDPWLKKPIADTIQVNTTVFEKEKKSWFQTYKPVLLIFAYITGITLLIQYGMAEFMWMEWMNHFMAGFFITFSFFKLLNLSGFADSYMSYDIIAKRWRGWGYVYAFVELGLGLAYILNFDPIVTNIVTLIVMGLSIIGVLQSVFNKRKIKCACLGDVFNLPMSTVTIIEDGLMISMSVIMLLTLL
ncbi:MAG: Heavy metal transport/detoxification protein [Bacteroidetes bacterium]|nr:Heavy metal transport/detoxification protein [Bacteroidota bacterium]